MSLMKYQDSGVKNTATGTLIKKKAGFLKTQPFFLSFNNQDTANVLGVPCKQR